MRKKSLLPFLLLLVVLAAACFWHETLIRFGTEALLNVSTREYFGGSVRLKEAGLDRNLRIRIQGFRAELQGEKGPFPVEIGQLESQGPIWKLFSGNGVLFDFKNAKPSSSREKGLEGTLQLKAGPRWFSKVDARIASLDLGDLAWFNPENLTGAQGRIQGQMVLSSNFKEESGFQGWVMVEEPGGRLGAHLFDAFLPYLPELSDKAKLRDLSSRSSLVGYRDARLEMSLLGRDRIKLFFHILVPDYNFNLNLHVEVRLDESDSFLKLVQIMGLVKIR